MFLRIDYSSKVISGNYLLRASAGRHSVRDFAGPLSVKTVVGGRVSWLVEGRTLTVRPGEMLVLNDSQPYSIELDSDTPAETRVVFFEGGFVEAACTGLSLDDPFTAAVAGFHSRVRPLTGSLHAAIESGDFIHIAEELAREQGYWRRVPALKPASRDELLNRVMRGREYLEESLCDAVRLKDAARIACLSEFHFHRMFRRVLGETPHSYVQRRRLEMAEQRIMCGEDPVGEIALACGFGKPGDLSQAFRVRHGISPSEYRRKIRKIPVACCPGQGVLFPA